MKQMKMAIPMVKFGNGNNKSWLPNTVNPIRIHPIMMSIIFHRYKMLKERTSSLLGLIILLKIMRTMTLMTQIISIQQY
jgi:hypothetical protein